MQLNDRIEKIKFDLSCILDKLENLDDDNFDQNISLINNAISETKRGKKALNSINEKNFLESDKSINIITKKIKIKLDNVIEKKENDLKSLSSELNNLNNQKKLALYKR